MNIAGKLVCADIRYKGAAFEDSELKAFAEVAVQRSNMRVMRYLYERFDPAGATLIFVLAESHFAMHTYPEERFVAVDCYTCGAEGDALAAIQYFVAAIDEKRELSANIEAIPRGRI